MNVWLVRGGRYGQHEHGALENGLAVIGFHRIPSLASRHTREQSAEAVADAANRLYVSVRL